MNTSIGEFEPIEVLPELIYQATPAGRVAPESRAAHRKVSKSKAGMSTTPAKQGKSGHTKPTSTKKKRRSA